MISNGTLDSVHSTGAQSLWRQGSRRVPNPQTFSRTTLHRARGNLLRVDIFTLGRNNCVVKEESGGKKGKGKEIRDGAAPHFCWTVYRRRNVSMPLLVSQSSISTPNRAERFILSLAVLELIRCRNGRHADRLCMYDKAVL